MIGLRCDVRVFVCVCVCVANGRAVMRRHQTMAMARDARARSGVFFVYDFRADEIACSSAIRLLLVGVHASRRNANGTLLRVVIECTSECAPTCGIGLEYGTHNKNWVRMHALGACTG